MKSILLGGLAVALAMVLSLAIPSSGSAQKTFFANVSADAQCTVSGADVLVEADLIQKDAPSSGPFVSTVDFALEQHLPNHNDWAQVGGSQVTVGVNNQFDLLGPGERYNNVESTDYPKVCELVNQAANAVRAVVKITVTNANTKRPGANVFTGRCISFPNPCK